MSKGSCSLQLLGLILRYITQFWSSIKLLCWMYCDIIWYHVLVAIGPMMIIDTCVFFPTARLTLTAMGHAYTKLKQALGAPEDKRVAWLHGEMLADRMFLPSWLGCTCSLMRSSSPPSQKQMSCWSKSVWGVAFSDPSSQKAGTIPWFLMQVQVLLVGPNSSGKTCSWAALLIKVKHQTPGFV